jgi:hypothetical protein
MRCDNHTDTRFQCVREIEHFGAHWSPGLRITKYKESDPVLEASRQIYEKETELRWPKPPTSVPPRL